MNKSPEISVIVPVYKAESYLPQCIESILSQTFADFELLLIDDGSPDRCGEICEEYARSDERIQVFHQENAGVSCARNTGLDKSCGRYVTFVDSDDYIRPRYLENLYATLPDDRNRMGVIAGALEAGLPDGEFRTMHVPELEISSAEMSFVLTDLIDRHIGYAGSKLYDNRIIKRHEIRFIPSITVLEDQLFLLDYLLHADFLYIRDYNDYIYRVAHSGESLSARITDFQLEYSVFSNFLERVRLYQKSFGLTDASLKKAGLLLTVFFHKILLAIYKPGNGYSRRERLFFLQQLLASDKEWIITHFMPQYSADKLGKFLLCYLGSRVFDAWMRFLSALKFKKMFGAK